MDSQLLPEGEASADRVHIRAELNESNHTDKACGS